MKEQAYDCGKARKNVWLQICFRLACERDLEGIVAKHKDNPYLAEHANWLKIRNRNYSQWAGREELFEREREDIPDINLWEACVVACERVAG